MITKGNRQTGAPVYFKEGKSTAFQRLALNGKDFKEEWIQKLIAEHPSMLPVNEIEIGFGPLVSVGREISTAAGPIDNLFVSPEGAITIVETKLWRNPQARREVVGQIIDYAKELSRWSFKDLDNAIKNCNHAPQEKGKGLFDLMRALNLMDEGEEQYFIDNVSKNLKRGRFLLLIVGDGIRESVEDMVEYLSQSPNLHFTLALIELQVYKMGEEDDALMVIPQVVTRTKEITRAIVKIQGNIPADVTINIETDLGTTATSNKNNNQSNLSISADDFFGQLLLNTNQAAVDFTHQIIKDAEASGFEIVWNSGSFAIKMKDPQGSGVKISLLNIDRKGLVYLGYSLPQLKKLNLPVELSYNLARDTADLLPDVEYNTSTNHSWNNYSTIADLQKVYQPFMERLKLYEKQIAEAGETDHL